MCMTLVLTIMVLQLPYDSTQWGDFAGDNMVLGLRLEAGDLDSFAAGVISTGEKQWMLLNTYGMIIDFVELC